MARISEDKNPKIIDGEVIPFKGTHLRIRLNSIKQVKNEMARVYCQARQGSLETSVASRLIYILSQMSILIRDHEIEARVEQLERLQDEQFKTKNYPA